MDLRNSQEPFADEAQVMSHNKADPSAKLYSRLDEMESFRSAVDNKLTFFLHYPELHPTKGFLFKQKDNPHTVTGTFR